MLYQSPLEQAKLDQSILLYRSILYVRWHDYADAKGSADLWSTDVSQNLIFLLSPYSIQA